MRNYRHVFTFIHKTERRERASVTPRSVLEQMKTIQMLDVRVPTTDGRWLHMSRYTQPDKLQQLLLAQLHLQLPAQPPPTISKEKMTRQLRCSEDFLEA